jgi:hypothetical protein
MKRARIFAAIFFMLGGVGITKAQLKVSGEFRTRSIVENALKVPAKKNSEDRLSFDQRSRLTFDYVSSKYTSRFTFQDARIWGSDDMMQKTGTLGNSYSLGVHEAWVNLTFGDYSALKVGRQEWQYDDMRILSVRNFWTSGLSYDGILYQMENSKKGLTLHLGLSYNNNGTPVGIFIDNSSWPSEKLKTMNFIYLKKKFSNQLEASVIATFSGKTDLSNNSVLGTGTHGVNINYNTAKGSPDGLYGHISGYYQHGTDIQRGADGQYRDISAYMINSKLGFRTLNKRLELEAGMELISGRDYSNSDEKYNNTRHSFDLLGSGRIPYYGGYMNHFVIQDSYLVGTKGGGYFDPFVKVRYKWDAKNMVEAGAFFPYLTTKVKSHTTIDPVTGKPSGTELGENGNTVYWKGSLGRYIDLAYIHKVNKEIIFKAGMSYGGVSDLKNQMAFGYEDVNSKKLYDMADQYFGWVMLIVKPTFFNGQN